jgi:putative DNA primase/helicase
VDNLNLPSLDEVVNSDHDTGNNCDNSSQPETPNSEHSAETNREADGSEGMPFILTNAQKAELKRRGYSTEAIRNMTPEEGHRILAPGNSAKRTAVSVETIQSVFYAATQTAGRTAVNDLLRGFDVTNLTALRDDQRSDLAAKLVALAETQEPAEVTRFWGIVRQEAARRAALRAAAAGYTVEPMPVAGVGEVAGPVRQDLALDGPHDVTVVRSFGPRIVKRWHLVDGAPVCEDTEDAAHFSYRSEMASTPEELAALIASLGPTEAIIPGVLIEGLDPSYQRRKRRPGGEYPPTIRDRRWGWFPFDLDSIAPIDDASEFDPLVEGRTLAVIQAALPDWTRGCAMVIQFTAGMGMKPGIRARVFVQLARPLSIWEMRAIAERDCAIADHSFYQPERLIYCGPVAFDDGIADPVARRVFTISGKRAEPPAAPAGWELKERATVTIDPAGLDWDKPLPETVFTPKPADQIIEKLGQTGKGVDRSAVAFALIVELADIGYTPNQVLALLHEHVNLTVLGHYTEKCDNPDAVFRRDIVKAFTTKNPNGLTASETFAPIPSEAVPDQHNGAPVLSHGTPLASAREFVKRCHTDSAGRCTLIRYRGDFYRWTGTHYRPLSDDEMPGQLYQFLDGALIRTKSEDGGWSVKPFAPDQTKVNKVQHALLGCGIVVSDYTDAPAWLKTTVTSLFGEAREFIACKNGLMHPSFPGLWPHEPELLNFNALEFDYDPQAPEPTEWLRFLASLWPSDQEAIDTLQEWFGYLVSGQTYLQKMLLMIGPKRSGKGTILHTIGALLGAENVSYSKLESLRNDFGLEPLIGKTAMLVGDSRMDTFARGQGSIVENLLSITGEDGRSVNRKFKTAWEGKLGARIVIASNEAPRFNDASGTIAHRIIPLRMRISFAEREDHGLKDRIMRELPGIFNWALTGLHRLTERRHFVIPQSARSTVEEIEASASPVKSFVDELCVVAPERRVDTDQLYAQWGLWCLRNGHPTGSQSEFGRKLNAAVPSLERKRATYGNPRPWGYIGIGLREGLI